MTETSVARKLRLKFIQCPSQPSSQTPSIVHSQTKQVQLSQALLQHAGGHQQSDPPLEQPGSHADRVPRGHGPEGHGKRFGSQVPKLVSKKVQLSHHCGQSHAHSSPATGKISPVTSIPLKLSTRGTHSRDFETTLHRCGIPAPAHHVPCGSHGARADSRSATFTTGARDTVVARMVCGGLDLDSTWCQELGGDGHLRVTSDPNTHTVHTCAPPTYSYTLTYKP